MKNIAFITPAPSVIETIIENSMLRKAAEKNVAKFHILDLRDFGIGDYKKIDHAPYGGGPGMVLMAEPLFSAINDALKVMNSNSDIRIVYPSPLGKKWNQKYAEGLSTSDNIIMICGHYKGIDERVIKKYVTDQFSIGDFVMTSGEIPAILMVDSVVRLIPGTLNNIGSALDDSFTYGLLDYPHYTRPRKLQEMEVPDVLISGHHRNINEWREKQRVKRTKLNRNDLWKKYSNSK